VRYKRVILHQLIRNIGGGDRVPSCSAHTSLIQHVVLVCGSSSTKHQAVCKHSFNRIQAHTAMTMRKTQTRPVSF